MTLYVDTNYYSNTYKGTMIPQNEIEKYLEKSQEKIDSITYNRIVRMGFNNLTNFQKEKVSKSICLQADYIYENGYNDGNNNDISSYSVLDISVNVKSNDVNKTKASKLHMDEEAYDLICKTGLNCPII